MLNIKDLYHDRANRRWCDYPIANGKHELYKINSPKPFKVYHEDGSFSMAYSFGEYQYTFSLQERDEARAKYNQTRKEAGERRALLAQLENLDTETLKNFLKKA